MTIPDEIIQKLIFICEKEGWGFGRIDSKDFKMLMLGNKNLSPDQASILAIHALAEGIINGKFFEANELRLEQNENEKKH